METHYQILNPTNISNNLKYISNIHKYIKNKTNKNVLIYILKFSGMEFSSKNELYEITIGNMYNKMTKFDHVILRSNTIPAKSLINDTVTYHDCLNINSFKINILKVTTGIKIEIGGTKIDKHYDDWMDIWKKLAKENS